VFTHILVPLDGGPLSRKAARAAARLAKSMNAKVTGIHVTPPFRPAAVDFYMPYEMASLEQYDASVGRSAAKILAQAEKLCRDAGVRYEGLHVTDDQPHRAIIAAAQRKRCDLVLMASHGRRGVAAVVLGSETTKVLTHSKVPVLVYR
jgi:nucleotide-binding universal stress UspA family protein